MSGQVCWSESIFQLSLNLLFYKDCGIIFYFFYEDGFIGNLCICILIEGKNSFQNQSLHRIGNTPNPYEQAIAIVGRTLSPFDEDNLIPCFGFGDGQ